MESATLFTALLLSQLPISFGDRRQLDRAFHWDQIKFDLGSQSKEAEMIASGDYIENQAVLVNLERWKDKLFLVTPRMKDGIPSSLNYVNFTDVNEHEDATPLLTPYPNLRMHNLTSGIMTSIVSVRLDRCNRLWAVDSGVVNMERKAPPAIHVINPRTNKLLRTRRLMEGVDFDSDSEFSNIVVDVTTDVCPDAYAYISDHGKHKLIVYSWKTGQSHRISHNFFSMDPLFASLVDENMRTMDSPYGLYSLALSQVERDGHRRLFFSPFASGLQFIVNTKILRNRSIDIDREALYDFKVMGNRSPVSQSSASVFDEETGVLFYTLTSRNRLGCWNYYKGNEFTEPMQWSLKGIPIDFFFPIDVKVDKHGMVWLLSNNYMDIVNNTTEIEFNNYQIFKARTRDAISDTICDV